MQTFQITVRYAQNETEIYVAAATADQAVAQAKATAIETLGWPARWVHAFA